MNKTNMKTLKDLFLDELADMYDAEHRIIKALPKLAKAATCENLKAAFLSHLKETEGQVTKLEKVFQAFGEKPKAKKCKATVGLLEEGDEIASNNKGEPTINAALISAGQKVEHYEIASYGCLHEWAGLLGNSKAASLIEEILDQEKAADKKLMELARASGNKEALCECDEKGCDEAKETTGKKPRKNLAVAMAR
jgi:ferritin-like metal-binding protein YciE